MEWTTSCALEIDDDDQVNVGITIPVADQFDQPKFSDIKRPKVALQSSEQEQWRNQGPGQPPHVLFRRTGQRPAQPRAIRGPLRERPIRVGPGRHQDRKDALRSLHEKRRKLFCRLVMTTTIMTMMTTTMMTMTMTTMPVVVLLIDDDVEKPPFLSSGSGFFFV